MRIAFLSDTHLDYASGHRFTADGVNLRAQDGYDALTQTVDQILDEGDIDLVVHGGDLFHKSIPTVRGIIRAREQFTRLHAAGIPLIGVVGNHDYPNTVYRDPASLAVNDPDRGIHVYADPYRQVPLADGVMLHVVSHGGLMPLTADPEPVAGMVNILITHGAAEIPDYNTLFTCEDSPAEAWIPWMILQRDWDLLLTGHYHNRHELPLPYPAWYAGSALRRGFSDPEGARGWVLLTVNSDGSVRAETRDIPQRPQFDLDVIDADGLTGDDVYERIRANLATVTGDSPIVRQRVVNVTSAVRRTVNIDSLPVEGFLTWQVRFTRPESLSAAGANRERGHRNLATAWSEFTATDPGILDGDRDNVTAAGRALIDGSVVSE